MAKSLKTKKRAWGKCSFAYIYINNTCHASRLNSAPGQVLAFIGVFKITNLKVDAFE